MEDIFKVIEENRCLKYTGMVIPNSKKSGHREFPTHDSSVAQDGQLRWPELLIRHSWGILYAQTFYYMVLLQFLIAKYVELKLQWVQIY